MKTVVKVGGLIVIGILIVTAAVLLLHSPAKKASPAKPLQWSDIQTDLKNGAKLYDVRTPQEYASGHVAEAENLNSVAVLTQNVSPAVPKMTKIYLYCQSGNRALQVKAALQSRGFTDVTNLGSITDVEAMGAQIVKS